jgi:hypothetical protein
LATIYNFRNNQLFVCHVLFSKTQIILLDDVEENELNFFHSTLLLHRPERKMRQTFYKNKTSNPFFWNIKAHYPFSVKEKLEIVSQFTAFNG